MNRRMLFLGAAIAAIAATSTAHAGVWDRLRGGVTGTWRCSSLEAEISIEALKPNGTKWDLGGDGAPDPYGRLTVVRSGQTIAGEAVGKRADSFSFTAPFFRRNGIELHRNDVVRIRLVDEDVSDDDIIGTASVAVSGRSMSGSADNGAFSVSVTCLE